MICPFCECEMDVITLNPDQREAFQCPQCQTLHDPGSRAPVTDLDKLRAEYLKKLHNAAAQHLGARRLELYQNNRWIAFINALNGHSPHAARTDHAVIVAYQTALVFIEQWMVDHGLGLTTKE